MLQDLFHLIGPTYKVIMLQYYKVNIKNKFSLLKIGPTYEFSLRLI